jgi:hypothetical protein
VQRCRPCCARRGREAPQGASEMSRRFRRARPETQAARLATLHRGDFSLRSRSSGSGQDEPRPPRSGRLSPAFDQTVVQQDYLRPLVSRGGRPTQSVPEAGLRIPPAGAALIPRLVASQETPLGGMR